MNTIIHKAEDRGRGDFSWLRTQYSFSFADWYDPSRMGFGKLSVINDDHISGGSGFGMHSHADMEIITLVTNGTLTHKDSLGNTGTVSNGEVQVMSAGTGVAHSEFNANPTELLELLQLWIQPNKKGVSARYEQAKLSSKDPGLTRLVGPMGTEEGLGINQNAYIYQANTAVDEPITYTLHHKGHGMYVFVLEGTVEVSRETLYVRDAMGITDADSIELLSKEGARLLIIEVPMI